MSLVLGPIHYLMYSKMSFQESITKRLLHNYPDLAQRIDEEQPPIQEGDIKDLIDQTNIHGWLSSCIETTESRLAAACRLVPDALSVVYQIGKETSSNLDTSDYQTLFSSLNPFLLDGMPCDRGLSANVAEEENALYLIHGNNQHPCFELEAPLSISPQEARDRTCSGNHDHDHHEVFDVHQFIPSPSTPVEISFFTQFRLAFLLGIFENTPYQVSLVDGKDFKISSK